jgi:hypothetical protein
MPWYDSRGCRTQDSGEHDAFPPKSSNGEAARPTTRNSQPPTWFKMEKTERSNRKRYIFRSVKTAQGHTYSQLFIGQNSLGWDTFPLKTES